MGLLGSHAIIHSYSYVHVIQMAVIAEKRVLFLCSLLVTTVCSLIGGYRRFGRTQCLYFEGVRWREICSQTLVKPARLLGAMTRKINSTCLIYVPIRKFF
jgi:hypothetical protein